MAAARSDDPGPLVLSVGKFSSLQQCCLHSPELWPHMEISFGKQRYFRECLLCLIYAESLLTFVNQILELELEMETSL